jgi:C4-dicarboxylate transporter, DctM subunit
MEETAKKTSIFNKIEDYLSFGLLFLLVALLLIEAVLRKTVNASIGAAHYIKLILIWLCFVSAVITSREKKHLAMSAGIESIKEPFRGIIQLVISFFCVFILTALSFVSIHYVFQAFFPEDTIGILPLIPFLLIIPVCMIIMAVRAIIQIKKGALSLIPIMAGILFGILYSAESIVSGINSIIIYFGEITGNPDSYSMVPLFLEDLQFTIRETLLPVIGVFSVPLLIILIASTFLGTPIFIVLSGVTLILFNMDLFGAVVAIPDQAYVILSNFTIPAIPLFALTGFFLSESKAGQRITEFAKSFLGWIPGGLVIVCVIVMSFFTSFTGGSGVAILAVGSLLSSVLINAEYEKKFSLGLVTGAGSVGILFVPSLPIIIYGVVAGTILTGSNALQIEEIFVGAFIPWILLVIALSVSGIIYAKKHKVETVKFEKRNLIPSLVNSLGEIMLPFIILFSYLSGFTTIVETGAMAVLYVFVLYVIIRKEVKLHDIPGILKKCVPIIGGILIIISMAKSLSNYIIDARIAEFLVTWMQTNISNKYLFLLLLNIALLITGCLMDIFSAILVVVPLIIPLGMAYGIAPVHLAIIFIINLQLGYLTPPVGLNLFLASYRFEEPLPNIYKNIIPFFLIMLGVVLLVTYIPFFSTALPGLLGY